MGIKYIFVEGSDDADFFAQILGDMFPEFTTIEYSKLTQEKVNSFLRTIRCIPDADYIFLCDSDGNTEAEKKEKVTKKYKDLSVEKVFVVEYEIESWYYAGASEDNCKRMKLKHYERDTNRLTKESFYSKMPKIADRKDIMKQMLDCYSAELAITRNRSIKAFFEAMAKERELAAV